MLEQYLKTGHECFFSCPSYSHNHPTTQCYIIYAGEEVSLNKPRHNSRYHTVNKEVCHVKYAKDNKIIIEGTSLLFIKTNSVAGTLMN
jgi:hypothetical protein